MTVNECDMREDCSRWYGHVHPKLINVHGRSNLVHVEGGKRNRGRLRDTLVDMMWKDMTILRLSCGMVRVEQIGVDGSMSMTPMY